MIDFENYNAVFKRPRYQRRHNGKARLKVKHWVCNRENLPLNPGYGELPL